MRFTGSLRLVTRSNNDLQCVQFYILKQSVHIYTSTDITTGKKWVGVHCTLYMHVKLT